MHWLSWFEGLVEFSVDAGVTWTSSAWRQNAPVFQSGSGTFADGAVGHVASVDRFGVAGEFPAARRA